MYDLKDYKEIKRGDIEISEIVWSNVILMENRYDTNYTAKIAYEDSTYSKVRTCTYYYRKIENGPVKSFVNGKLFMEGFYVDGKRDGPLIFYGEHYIRNKQYFKKGVKVGIWEEYDGQGKLKRKTLYDGNGKIKKDIVFDNVNK